jgi:hypothetical protein
MWLAAHVLGLQLAGYFNLELAAIGILVVAISPLPIWILLLCATALDIVSSISWTYMLPPFDLLQSARSVGEYLPSHVWALAAVVLALAVGSLASVVVLSRLESGHERRMAALILGTFSACCIITDLKTGQIRTFHPDKLVGSIRLTREPLRVLRLAQRYGGRFAGGPVAPFDRASTLPIQRVSMDSFGQQLNRPNVVLVLVESWGKPLSRDVDESLVRPYMSDRIQRKYTVSVGTVGFYGPTVAGEARELCGSTMGFEIIHATSAQLKSCLPAWFRQMNYHTTAIHGFAGGMFQRKDWYARAGFEERWFREGLAQEGLARCTGAFPGICDAAVPGWIGRHLLAREDSPQFVYWVTLNSHLPVPVPNAVRDSPTCSGTLPATFDAPLCSWYQLIFNVHRSVSELALAPSSRPTIFIVVGDHAPPFSNNERRRQFSGSVVPYVVLMPKQETDALSQGSIAAVHERKRVRPIHLSEARYDPGT